MQDGGKVVGHSGVSRAQMMAELELGTESASDAGAAIPGLEDVTMQPHSRHPPPPPIRPQ